MDVSPLHIKWRSPWSADCSGCTDEETVIMVQVGHGFISINPVFISDGVRQCGNKRLELNHGAGDSI